jgi:hypothetical protein
MAIASIANYLSVFDSELLLSAKRLNKNNFAYYYDAMLCAR